MISFFYIFAMKFQIYSTLLQVIKIISLHQAEVSTVPFFWTVQFGKSIRYAGHGHGWEDVIYQARFVFFFAKSNIIFFNTGGGGEVVGVLHKRRRGGRRADPWKRSYCCQVEEMNAFIHILRIFLYFVYFLH